MIERAIGTMAEHTTEQAKEKALEAARDAGRKATELAERLRDSTLVEKALESDLIERVRHEEKKLKKRRQRRKKQKGSRVSWKFVVLGAIGLAAVAYFVRSRMQRDEMIQPGPVPDAFGAAVAEERASANGGQPVATPGA